MKYSNKWFSFIEVLISVAILIVLAAVGITYSDNMTDKSNNSKVKTELSTLQNSFTLYQSDVKAPILPSGNQKFFSSWSTYAHDQVGAFWVSGFATETTIPKKYINYLPVDPKTNQYYAYATTLETGEFEVAGLIKHNKTYQALVNGTYTGNETIPNLIREYNGPNFVFNKSLDALPYNPYERILTAKIHNFTGTVVVNDTPRSLEELKDLDLFEWDTIKVGTGEFAEIFFSDGSQSTLWDSEISSELTLANMRFPEEYNLTTQIKLALSVGSLWTKASKMSEKSQFEIYTIDSVAAVRWTVFGVRKDSSWTNTVVLEWKVEVSKINGVQIPFTFADLEEGINSANPNFFTGALWNGLIEVPKWNSYSWISVNTFTSSMGIASTWAILKIPTDESKEKIIENAGNINSNITLKVLKLDKDNKSVELELTPTLKTATKLFLNGTGSNAQNYFDGSSIFVTNLVLGENVIQLCDALNCTAPLKLNLNNQTSFTKPIIDNMIDDVTVPEVPETCIWGIKAQGTCGENLMGNDWEVTHFAPFDSYWLLYQWDSINHFKDNYPMVTKSWILGPNQSGWVMLLNNWAWIPYLTWWVFENWSSISSGLLLTRNTNILNDLNIWFNRNNHIIKMWWMEWVFIDNTGTDSFLKYTFDPWTLSWSFAIEMQVRGADLKRSWTYYLFNAWNVYLDLHLNYLYLWHSWFTNVKKIGTWAFDANKLYTIQAIFEWSDWDIKVHWEKNINVQTTWFSWTIVSSTDIFIWSNTSSSQQWNGVIDYVKIYKKNN